MPDAAAFNTSGASNQSRQGTLGHGKPSTLAVLPPPNLGTHSGSREWAKMRWLSPSPSGILGGFLMPLQPPAPVLLKPGGWREGKPEGRSSHFSVTKLRCSALALPWQRCPPIYFLFRSGRDLSKSFPLPAWHQGFDPAWSSLALHMFKETSRKPLLSSQSLICTSQWIRHATLRLGPASESPQMGATQNGGGPVPPDRLVLHTA